MSMTLPACPETLVILGSGWNKALSKTEVTNRIPYAQAFGHATTVPGHSGELVYGVIGGTKVVFMSGRFHLYEGYSGTVATEPLALLHNAGVRRVVITSASGALNPDYRVGDTVVLSDVLTLFLKSHPLVGPDFVDMSSVFDPAWRQHTLSVLKARDIVPREGVYAYMSGPHYETPADKRALAQLGADCVGMSTVPELLRARSLGMQVLGLSLITNLAFVKHSHQEVVAAANASSEQMAELIEQVVYYTLVS